MLRKTWTQDQIIAALTASALKEGEVVEGDINFTGETGVPPKDPHSLTASADVSRRVPTARGPRKPKSPTPPAAGG